MADKTKITKDWSNADQFLRERYEPTKKYVDNQINPEFIYDETAVSCKTIPENVKDFAVIEKIYGKTIKEYDTLKSAPIESVVSLSKNLFYMTNAVSGVINGITYTINNDNSITINGTSTNTVTIALMGKQSEPLDIFGDDTYSLIWSDKSGTTEQTGIGLKIGNTSGASYDSSATPTSKIYTITGTVGYIYFRVSSGRTFNNLTIYPKLVKGVAISTEYTPYNKTTISVPDSIKNLEGYGLGISDTVRNYVDFENGKYYKYCGSVDMGSMTITETSTAGLFNAVTLNPPGKAATLNAIASIYQVIDSNASFQTTDKSVRIATNTTTLGIHDSAYAGNASGLKTSLSGQMFVYELATPEVIDIIDIIRPIKCETGGTITLVNEHSLDVQNTIIYEREVSEHD